MMKPESAAPPRVHITPNAAKNWRIYEKEIATYLRELPQLLAEGKEGQHALIKDDAVLGVWDDQSDALAEGCKRFGLNPIFVKNIDARDAERFALFFEAIKEQNAGSI
jgi:hypothetical protein